MNALNKFFQMTKTYLSKNEATIIRFSSLTIAEVMMKKSHIAETQVVNILKLADSGIKANDIK